MEIIKNRMDSYNKNLNILQEKLNVLQSEYDVMYELYKTEEKNYSDKKFELYNSPVENDFFRKYLYATKYCSKGVFYENKFLEYVNFTEDKIEACSGTRAVEINYNNIPKEIIGKQIKNSIRVDLISNAKKINYDLDIKQLLDKQESEWFYKKLFMKQDLVDMFLEKGMQKKYRFILDLGIVKKIFNKEYIIEALNLFDLEKRQRVFDCDEN